MKCPDCGKTLDRIMVEKWWNKEAALDHNRKVIREDNKKDWEHNDTIFHCPYCDSLNVNELLSDYDIEIIM